MLTCKSNQKLKIFSEEEKIKELFIRIGSMDYEPSQTVKPHTLD